MVSFEYDELRDLFCLQTIANVTFSEELKHVHMRDAFAKVELVGGVTPLHILGNPPFNQVQ